MSFRFATAVAIVALLALAASASFATGSSEIVLIKVCEAANMTCSRNCRPFYSAQNVCFNGTSNYTGFVGGMTFKCRDFDRCVSAYRFQDLTCSQQKQHLTIPCNFCDGTWREYIPELFCNEQSVVGVICNGTKCQNCSWMFNVPVDGAVCTPVTVEGQPISVSIDAYKRCSRINVSFFGGSPTCEEGAASFGVISGDCSYSQSNGNGGNFEFDFECVPRSAVARVMAEAPPISAMPPHMMKALRQHVDASTKNKKHLKF